MKFYATCKLGLESLVTRQLRDLDIEVLETEDARVSFSGGAMPASCSLRFLRSSFISAISVLSFSSHSSRVWA